MPTPLHTPATRAPVAWVVAAIISAAVGLVSLNYALSPVRTPSDLVNVTGQLESVRTSCGRGGAPPCWIAFLLRSAEGHASLVMKDTPTMRRVAATVRVGDTLDARGWPVSEFGSNLLLWELRRGELVLVPYDETALEARTNRRRWLLIALGAAGVAVLGFGIGIVHLVRWRSWRIVA